LKAAGVIAPERTLEEVQDERGVSAPMALEVVNG
jgi:hypothetical protein